MKRIVSLVAALLAVLALTASISASTGSASITLDQAQPVAPGSQVTFTVTGKRAAYVYTVCRPSPDPATYKSATLPVIAGSAGPFTVPETNAACHASLLDESGKPILGAGGVVVHIEYCVASSGTCVVYD